MNKSTYEEYLAKYGSLTYRNVGVSMLPMLKQDRDLFTVLKKTDERCKMHDVVLYRRPSGQYVLHRIVKVREKDYILLGDNCEKKEYGITDDDILGILSSFIHRGREVRVSDKRYILYAQIWYLLYPVRRLWLRSKHFREVSLSIFIRKDNNRN